MGMQVLGEGVDLLKPSSRKGTPNLHLIKLFNSQSDHAFPSTISISRYLLSQTPFNSFQIFLYFAMMAKESFGSEGRAAINQSRYCPFCRKRRIPSRQAKNCVSGMQRTAILQINTHGQFSYAKHLNCIISFERTI